MKLHIQQSPEYQEVEITIQCGMMDERLAALVEQIQLYAFSIEAKQEGRSYMLGLEKIYYFESVEEKTFIYCKSEVYECSKRLYELESQLKSTSFIRTSKSVLLNTAQVLNVRSLLGGRLEAQLENGELALINRHYVPAFKAKFGIEGGL